MFYKGKKITLFNRINRDFSQQFYLSYLLIIVYLYHSTLPPSSLNKT